MRYPRFIRPEARRLVAGGLAAAILTGTVAGAALAQSATPPTTGSPPPAVQQRQQTFLNDLASKLGKSSADVLAAFKAAEKDMVATDLQAGKITQAQATQANQRIDQSTGIGMGGRGFEGPERGKGARGPEGLDGGSAALAQFLGVQPADLRTAFQANKSLAQIAQDHGKTRDQLKAFLTQQAKTRLDQAVTNGKITQDQENQRLATLASGLDQRIDRTGPPAGERGENGPRGRGGPGGPRGQAPAAPTTSPTPGA